MPKQLPTLKNQPFSTKQNCFKIQMKSLSLAALKLISQCLCIIESDSKKFESHFHFSLYQFLQVITIFQVPFEFFPEEEGSGDLRLALFCNCNYNVFLIRLSVCRPFRKTFVTVTQLVGSKTELRIFLWSSKSHSRPQKPTNIVQT